MNLTQMVDDLVAAYEQAEANLKQREAELTAELAGLRAERNSFKAAVRALAPERLAKPKTKTSKAGLPPRKYVAEETVGLVRAVVSGLNGDQFTPAELLAQYGQRLPADATVKLALRVMHAHGELRLVKTGRGGQKTYEVIR